MQIMRHKCRAHAISLAVILEAPFSNLKLGAWIKRNSLRSFLKLHSRLHKPLLSFAYRSSNAAYKINVLRMFLRASASDSRAVQAARALPTPAPLTRACGRKCANNLNCEPKMSLTPFPKPVGKHVK